MVGALLPNPAQALPFASNCASMQSYFNTRKWNQPTKFSGFNNTKGTFYSDISVANCLDGGYITETSPMGTQVCFGSIYYAGGKVRWYAAPGNCRWK